MNARTRAATRKAVPVAAPAVVVQPRLVRSHELPVESNLQQRGASRVFDISSTLLLAAVFLPLIVVVVAALACSGGPVLFRQTRLGRGGKPFTVYKFRTMVPDATRVLDELLARDPQARDEWARDAKLRNDPRVTSLGRFLRKTSLDELPQLWNILRGDMSLVGPRPIEPCEIEKYGRYARHYYAQRPGLTGLWQVSGRSNTSYERRVILDAYYSRNRSLWMDIGIALRTVRVVLAGSGAY
jgi:undecaprenyl-phosphate galactose phosphotransferase